MASEFTTDSEILTYVKQSLQTFFTYAFVKHLVENETHSINNFSNKVQIVITFYKQLTIKVL